MASLTELRDLALTLPEVSEGTGALLSWIVAERPFLWERPLRKSDLKALSGSDPRALSGSALTGHIFAARLPDLTAKDDWLERCPACFTTPHFEGYPAVLFVLEEIESADLGALVQVAWQATVSKPKRKRRKTAP